jgi:hypothetical protein
MKTPVRQMLDRAGAADPISDRREFPTVREAVRWFHERDDPGTRVKGTDGRAAQKRGRSAAPRAARSDPTIG